MHGDVPDGIEEGEVVRVEMVDGYWFEGEVKDVGGHIEIRDRRRESPLPEPDGEGDYRPHFIGIKRQLITNSDGDPTFHAVDLDDGDFRLHDPDAPLEVEVVYIDRESDEWTSVTLGEVETFERLE
jgi:hypothetical protein